MNKNHKIIINWGDASNTFLAHVPELSGCIADGNSFAEAIANVQILIDQVVMEELFETTKLPGRSSKKNSSKHNRLSQTHINYINF